MMKKNKAEFTYGELIVLLSSSANFDENYNTIYKGISTDTRTIENGNIFIALKGENFDANTKIPEAFEKGASVAIANEKYYNKHKNELSEYPIFTVNDTLRALGKLARFHRDKFDIPVIAVGGSNGKTTTKEMIAAVLSKAYNLLKTEGNYNNQIGVPLTLLQMNHSHNAAVIEIGTNEPGEIALLTSIVNPTAGLITNIGREHLERLINLDGVEMEETFLFGHLKKYGGTALINFDDERLKKYQPLMDKSITYGTDEDAEVFAAIEFNEKIQPTITVKDKSILSDIDKELNITLNAIGYAAAQNAIAAVATGLYMKIPPDDIIAALEEFRQDDSHGYARMVIQEINEITVLNDCYNANPDSMRMALKTLKEIKSDGRKFAVLGDMRELGDASFDEHLSLLKEISGEIDDILVLGDEMSKAASELNSTNIKTFAEHSELSRALKSLINTGDILLVKGSRGMEMEKIIQYLSL